MFGFCCTVVHAYLVCISIKKFVFLLIRFTENVKILCIRYIQFEHANEINTSINIFYYKLLGICLHILNGKNVVIEEEIYSMKNGFGRLLLVICCCFAVYLMMQFLFFILFCRETRVKNVHVFCIFFSLDVNNVAHFYGQVTDIIDNNGYK